MFLARSCPTIRSKANLRKSSQDNWLNDFLRAALWSPFGFGARDSGQDASWRVKRHIELHCEGTRTAPKTLQRAKANLPNIETYLINNTIYFLRNEAAKLCHFAPPPPKGGGAKWQSFVRWGDSCFFSRCFTVPQEQCPHYNEPLNVILKIMSHKKCFGTSS